MMLFQFTLSKLLFGGIDPAYWKCPIQWGIPIILHGVANLLLWAAAFAFLAGILLTVYYYLTAYGNEEKAKRAQETLKWTVVGAVVIILAQIIINIFVDLLAADQPIESLIPKCEQSAPSIQNKSN